MRSSTCGVGCTVEQGEESVDHKAKLRRKRQKGVEKGDTLRSPDDGIINSVNAQNEWGLIKKKPSLCFALEMIPKEDQTDCSGRASTMALGLLLL